MSFLPVFTKMVELFLIIVVGYTATHLGVLNKEIKSGLSKIILNISIPCTILSSVMNSENIPGGKQMALLLAVAFSSYIVLFILAKTTGFILRAKGPQLGAVEFGIMFANVGFIGFPVTQAIFGNDALLYTSMFNLPFNILCYSVGAAFVSSHAGQSGDAAAQRPSFLKLLLTPAAISSMLALVMTLLRYQGPRFLADTFTVVGGMTTPGALLVIGMALAELPLKDMLTNGKAYLFSFIAVVVTPLIMFAIYRPFTTGDTLLFGETVIISGMPVATSGTMLAVTYHGDERFMAQITFISTLASVFTIPLLAMLL